MKINLNLSYAESFHDRYALAWAISTMILGVVGAVVLTVSTIRAAREYREVYRQAVEVERRGSALRLREAALRRELESPQHRELLTKTRFVNTLIDQKHLSLTTLTARLTELMPENARVTSLAMVSKDGDYLLRIMVAAKSEEAVEALLGGMRDAPDFKDASITNEGFQEESTTPGEVRIICTARYLPGVK